MARTSLEYLRLLQSLLPRGLAWNRDEDSGLTQFLYGLGEEPARVDKRSERLLIERDTRFTTELLIDHELDLGLPDECSPEYQTIAERRLATHTKLITLGQQNPNYFIELAAASGWTITITEFKPFWSGVGAAGEECGDQEVIFYWKITIQYGEESDIIWATSGGSVCGDLISTLLGLDNLMCSIARLKPAHTTVLFGYDGPEYSFSFGPAFDAMASSTETYLEGAFWHEFCFAFDVHHGGEYSTDSFGEDFRKPV